ncbi:Diaminohydroxyphosphoribosylaminopyrimidine deaminase / 5-amino-6-(5-phosphoribosylamino)uracil reductase, partial [hydrothermal vent metagenome]
LEAREGNITHISRQYVYSKLMHNKNSDIVWMRRAVDLARRGKGRTSPNPAVGAVIVKNGRVIGEGWHKRAGGPHAEIAALASCKTSAKGAVIYVTLEPCNHTGRTGPCAVALIEAGLSEVVIGSKDISPKKGRRGIEALKRAGIKTRAGVLKGECDRLIENFIKHSSTGMPHVTLKAAMTLDGKIATRTGDSKWISSSASRSRVHRMRNEMDAVIVGSDTVIADDPQLTVRHGRPRLNPLRVIVDGALNISVKSKIITTAHAIPTLVAVTKSASPGKIEAIRKAGAEVIVIKGTSKKINLRALLKELGKRGIMSAMMESGGALAGAAIKAGLIDRVLFFIAPKIAGGDYYAINIDGVAKMSEAWELDEFEVARSGPDIMIEGRIITKG